jgi:hypothetical protein
LTSWFRTAGTTATINLDPGVNSLVAYDAATCKPLWITRIGNLTKAPQTYMLDGRRHLIGDGRIRSGDSCFTDLQTRKGESMKTNSEDAVLDRRDFFKASASAGLMAAAGQASAAPLTDKEKLARIASNTWPLRYLFKARMGFGSAKSEEMKKKYGEISLLDFPQFTKDTFPGVTHMDLFGAVRRCG